MDRSRAFNSLFGIFVGDALAMPVHWYYSLSQLKTDFPKGIRGYEKPKLHLPGSILSLSSTGGGGRGSDQGSIVGDVINHGKRPYWKRGANYHYHCTLKKGENTLEASLGRLMLRTMLATPKASFDKLAWLGAFDTFMTTPDSHNDVYASTYIRMFFANRAQGKELLQSADNDGHNTDAIDALTLVGVVTVSALANGDDVHAKVTDYITSARRSSALPGYCHIYADMLVRLLTRDLSEASPADALRQAAVAAGQQLGVDVAAMAQREYARSDPMTACYIASAFPALLVFAYKYASDPVACLLASANAGGENVARGGALGALVGAAHGGDPAGVWTAPSWVKADLKDAEVIESEINAALDGMGV